MGYRERTNQRPAVSPLLVIRVAPDLFYRSGEKVRFDPAHWGILEFRRQRVRLIETVKPNALIAGTEAILERIAADPAAADGSSLREVHGRAGVVIGASARPPSSIGNRALGRTGPRQQTPRGARRRDLRLQRRHRTMGIS